MTRDELDTLAARHADTLAHAARNTRGAIVIVAAVSDDDPDRWHFSAVATNPRELDAQRFWQAVEHAAAQLLAQAKEFAR